MIETTDTNAAAEALTRDELVRCFSVLSHDLKSPIFAIDGFSDLLIADYQDKLDADGQDFLRRIRAAAHQLRKVLDDMSHMIKLLSRPNALREVDLRDMAEELRLKFANLIEAGGVQVEIAPEMPVVRCDPEKMREAMGALLSNALHFNDHEKGERRVTIDGERAGDQVTIRISDNGIGIDPRYAQQIFDLGVKLDKSRGGGPGYGLFLARRVAESHGGAVTVESTPGEGSRFTLAVAA